MGMRWCPSPVVLFALDVVWNQQEDEHLITLSFLEKRICFSGRRCYAAEARLRLDQP